MQKFQQLLFCVSANLVCDESMTDTAANGVGIAALNVSMPPLLIMLAKMDSSPPGVDDIISLVSAYSMLHGSTILTSVCRLPAGDEESVGLC